MKDLAVGTGCTDWYTQKDQFSYLCNVPIPALPKSGKVSVLIGTNYLGLYRQLDQVHHEDYKTKPEFHWQFSISWVGL
jgi:hypothetical protein